MDPFTLLIGLAVAGYVIGGVTVDAIAVARRMPAPSHEKWKARHEAKQQRGERSDPNPSYLQRVIGNAAEKWAVKSDSKHRADMEFLEERAPQMTAKRLARRRRNAARYETAAQTVADKAGVLWGKTRDAAEQARERRTESRAWRENERRDQQGNDTGLDIVDTAGWIDEQGRGHPRHVVSDRGAGWELPVIYDDHGAGWYVHPDGSHSRVDENPDGLAAIDDALDESDNVVPFQRPEADKQEDSSKHDSDENRGQDPDTTFVPHPDRPYGLISKAELARRRELADQDRAEAHERDRREHEATEAAAQREYAAHQEQAQRDHEYRIAELNQPATIPAADTPAQEGFSTMAEIGSPEITSLSEAQTYTGSMTTSLEQIQVQVDSWSAELTGLADQAEQANVEVEQAIASLRSRDIDGDHLARMEAARDEFSAIAERFRSASEAVGQASGSAESGAAAFRTAHDAFQAQTSLGEEMQAAEASGNRPGDREFYLNG